MKNRIIIDIKNLNDLIVFNVYLILIQIEIIARLFEYIHIIVINAILFFY